jgi:hypothetical protein
MPCPHTIGVSLRPAGLGASTLELEASAPTRGVNVSTIAGSPRGSSDVDIAELAPRSVSVEA